MGADESGRIAQQVDKRSCSLAIKTREWFVEEQEPGRRAEFARQSGDCETKAQG